MKIFRKIDFLMPKIEKKSGGFEIRTGKCKHPPTNTHTHIYFFLYKTILRAMKTARTFWNISFFEKRFPGKPWDWKNRHNIFFVKYSWYLRGLSIRSHRRSYTKRRCHHHLANGSGGASGRHVIRVARCRTRTQSFSAVSCRVHDLLSWQDHNRCSLTRCGLIVACLWSW